MLLGQLLLMNGIISTDTLEKALAFQKAKPWKRLGDILVEEFNIDHDSIGKTVAGQIGAEYVPSIQEVHIDHKIAALIPSNVALRYKIIAIARDKDQCVTVAMVNPTDSKAIEHLHSIFKFWKPVVAGYKKFEQVMETHYPT